MAKFKGKTETELARLPDEALLAYIAAARDSGESKAEHTAAAILGFRYSSIVRARVRARTPPKDVEDVVMEVMQSIFRSSFDGRHVGQFRSWVLTITSRRIADYHASAERHPNTLPLPDEHEGEEEFWIVAGREDPALALLPYRELAEQIRCARKKKTHRDAIALYGPVELGYKGLDAAATKAEVEILNRGETMTEANVHQIWRRFKEELDEAIEAADGGTTS